MILPIFFNLYKNVEDGEQVNFNFSEFFDPNGLDDFIPTTTVEQAKGSGWDGHFDAVLFFK